MSDFDPFGQENQQNQNGGFNPFVRMPPLDQQGISSRNFGIIALILSIFGCCLPAGIVLGILAVSRAARSRRYMGYLSAEAELGRTLGIIAIVVGSLALVATVLIFVLTLLLQFPTLSGGAGGGTLV